MKIMYKSSFNVIETFWTNPQFRVKIDELNDECASGQRPENILVSLIQNHEKRNRNSQENVNIGFYVFEVSFCVYYAFLNMPNNV